MPQPATNDFPRQYAVTRRFTTGTPRDIKIALNGAFVTFLRSASPESATLTLWGFDTAAGTEHRIVDLAALGADDTDLPAAERARRERARESAAGIVAYALDDSRSLACFALGGELYVADLASQTTRRVTSPGGVFDPKFSPDGASIAFVSGRALFVVGADGATPAVQLCGEDDPLVSWGRAEFIAAEEMQRSAGYWWAPDSASLIVARTDDTAVARWWISDPAHPDTPPNEIRYPAAGTTNAAVTLHHIPARSVSDTKRAVVWDEGGRFDYLVDVVWDEGHDPLFVRQTRDQRLIDIATMVPDTGELSTVHTIADDIWVEIFPGTPAWAGNRLVTIEDRGEHRAICVDGTPIATPDLQVRGLIQTTKDDILITAWTSPSEIHLVSVSLADGSLTQLSQPGGVSTGTIRDDIQVISRADNDTKGSVTTIRRAGKTTGRLTSFATDPVVTPQPLFRQLGPRQLNCALLLPSWHNGTQPLPVLCDPYGGPHAQRVLQSSNAHAVSQWFAELGYAVLVADGRGTPGRGPQFERTVFGNLADPVLDDQIDALDAAKVEFPFLDLDRVGIRGWSFGGYLAALAVLRRPDRFHAGLAGAPVTAWELYDTHYTERYLGHPSTSPEAYAASDLLRLPSQWDHANTFPPLMLIHGLADDNVVAAHTLRLSSALLAAGLPHEVLPLTGVTHMTPQEVVAENLLRIQADFLANALDPQPPNGH